MAEKRCYTSEVFLLIGVRRVQSATENIIIEARSISHEYDDRLLFEPLDLTIRAGELLALSGPNGVGKSTLLRCLAGLILPYQGDVLRPAGFSCAYLGHGLGLRLSLSGLDNLSFAIGLFAGQHEAVKELVQQAGLERIIDAPVAQYSAGQRKRLALIRQVCLNQALWLLDEPASNLDQDGRAWMVQLCQQHLAAGGAIVMAHHGALPDELCAAAQLQLKAASLDGFH
jgi:heme exporter protein A